LKKLQRNILGASDETSVAKIFCVTSRKKRRSRLQLRSYMERQLGGRIFQVSRK